MNRLGLIRENHRMPFTCAYCGGNKYKSFLRKDAKDGQPLAVAACLECGLAQLAEIPSDEALKEFYGSKYRIEYKGRKWPTKKHAFRAGTRAKERLSKMGPFIKVGYRHLDVGSGGGEFTYLAKQAGMHAQGIDLATDYLEFARDTYDLTLRNIGLLDIPDSETYQVITMFHVLEHLPRPDDAFAKVHDLLVDDGIFVVEVPNLESKRTSPTNTYFKAHTTYFTQASLEILASKYFSIEFFEKSKYLFAVLRKKPLSNEPDDLRALSVETSLSRLENKNLGEYAANGGLTSMLRKIGPVFREKLIIAGKSHKAVLDRFNR